MARQAPLVAIQNSFNTRLAAGWEALERMYANENAPDGMSGLGERAASEPTVHNAAP